MIHGTATKVKQIIPKSEIIVKNKNKFKEKIKLNHIPSNYRNYISNKFLKHSKTMLYPAYSKCHLNLPRNKAISRNKDFFNFDNFKTNTINIKLNSLNQSKLKIITNNKSNDSEDFDRKLNLSMLNRKKEEKQNLINFKRKLRNNRYNNNIVIIIIYLKEVIHILSLKVGLLMKEFLKIIMTVFFYALKAI